MQPPMNINRMMPENVNRLKGITVISGLDASTKQGTNVWGDRYYPANRPPTYPQAYYTQDEYGRYYDRHGNFIGDADSLGVRAKKHAQWHLQQPPFKFDKNQKVEGAKDPDWWNGIFTGAISTIIAMIIYDAIRGKKLL